MPVYVDDMKAKFGRMVMCHMLADTTEELDDMARRIGVALKWRQYSGTFKEHYDIATCKRALAIKHGAFGITYRQSGLITRNRMLAYSGREAVRPIRDILIDDGWSETACDRAAQSDMFS